ncbi:MAG: hypothetical protein AAF721_13705 [Myxococcota bacterium]
MRVRILRALSLGTFVLLGCAAPDDADEFNDDDGVLGGTAPMESGEGSDDGDVPGDSGELPPAPPSTGDIRWELLSGSDVAMDLGEAWVGVVRLDPGSWSGVVELTAEVGSSDVAVHFESAESTTIDSVVLEASRPQELTLVVASAIEAVGGRIVVPAPRASAPVRIVAEGEGASASEELEVTTSPYYFHHLVENFDEPDAPLFGMTEIEMSVGTIFMIVNAGAEHTMHSDGMNEYPHMKPGMGDDFINGMAWNPRSNALYAPGEVDGAQPFTVPAEEETYCHDHGEQGHEGQRIKIHIVP